MKKKAFIIGSTICVIICLLNSCLQDEKKGFYGYSMLAHDVWRIPIIEPYDVTTAYCCDTWSSNKEMSTDFNKGFTFSLDSVNLINEFIILHSQDNIVNWAVLNIKNKKMMTFDSRNKLNKYLREIGVKNNHMYSLKDVNSVWSVKDSLPWFSKLPSSPSIYPKDKHN